MPLTSTEEFIFWASSNLQTLSILLSSWIWFCDVTKGKPDLVKYYSNKTLKQLTITRVSVIKLRTILGFLVVTFHNFLVNYNKAIITVLVISCGIFSVPVIIRIILWVLLNIETSGITCTIASGPGNFNAWWIVFKKGNLPPSSLPIRANNYCFELFIVDYLIS